MSDKLSLPAPAKLNLFLHITGRREDGYHLLQSIFQFLDYGDTLDFELRNDGVVSRVNDVPGVPVEQDLVIRAAVALQKHCGSKKGAAITVHKRLPMGGGLGGGSSDAATTLLGLNQLWQCGCSLDELADIGLALGADVPVFVRGHSAWAEGVGERLTPVNPPELWFLVISPGIHVDTGKIFTHPELTRDQQILTIRDSVETGMVNVCQPLVERYYPPVAEAIAWLSEYGEARMTGTGACVFAPFPTREAAEKVLQQGLPAALAATGQGFVARGCNINPVYKYLNLR